MHQNYLEPYKFDMQAQEHGHLCSTNFPKNKALEQKLIGPMEESHTKEQSPQAVFWEVLWARRSKMAAKRAWTRVWDGYSCLGEEEGVYGWKDKWRRATMGPRGRGRALHPCGQVEALLLCSQCQIFSNIPEKIIFKFQGIWRTFIFEVFLYCTDNQITGRKIFIFILFNINNRK